MKAQSITMLELRERALEIVQQVEKGKRFLLSYRGKPVARLEPVESKSKARADDPFYHICELSIPKGKPLSNEEIDRAIYGI